MWPIEGEQLNFRLFNTALNYLIANKICRWLDSNCGSLVLEANATAPWEREGEREWVCLDGQTEHVWRCKSEWKRERDNISDQVQNPACSFLHIFDFSFFAKLKHRKTFSLCRLFRFKDTAFSLLFTTWILATLNLGYVRVLTYSYTYSSTYSLSLKLYL